MTQPLTPQQLDDIDAAIAAYQQHAPTGFACCSAHPAADTASALVAEVRRLTAELADQVRYAATLEADLCTCEPLCENGEYLHAADCPVVDIQMQVYGGPDEETHVVADDSSDPEHIDDCPGCDTTDTLPAWLAQRFDPRGADWEQLGDDDRAYWEHQARAVRRAVARGGFKAPAVPAP